MNRHLALQILAGGRATVQSREILGEIAKTARAGEGECPEILPVPDSSDKPIPITELSERFESGIYFCEGALAAKALAAIKDAN